MQELGWQTLTLLVSGSALAGLIDAVIGGGGLVLIPLLMTVPSLSVPTALGTNKLVAIGGTASAAATLYRKVGNVRPLIWVVAPLALVAAAAGAALAGSLPAGVLRPIVIVLLLAVGVLVATNPELGHSLKPPLAIAQRVLAFGVLLVLLIAAYDGFFGPGTGMFLILTLSGILGINFVNASVGAKILNTATNLGALGVFALHGHVMWSLGLVLALANIVGAQIGAHLVIHRGVPLLRKAMLIIIVVLVIKLVYDSITA